MGIFSFLFGNKKKKTTVEAKPKIQNVDNENTEAINVDMDTARDISKIEKVDSDNNEIINQAVDTMQANADISEGMIFQAPPQLNTPLWILKKHGEIYKEDGDLHLIDGVNKTIISSLIDAGITTIVGLKAMEHTELLKIKGIGKVSGEKIKKALANKSIS